MIVERMLEFCFTLFWREYERKHYVIKKIFYLEAHNVLLMEKEQNQEGTRS
jgi:hypothetical protein